VSVETTDSRTQVLEQLLTEARSEADSLRKRLKRFEKIVLSTRLIMGHELKKPTTAISGYLDLVSEDLAAAESLTTLSYVQKALEQCRLLDELNKFYLELLKVEQEEESLGVKIVDVAALIESVVRELPPDLNAEVRVKTRVSSEAGSIEFNPNALRLIVLNLIENALIYSQAKTPVNIEVERTVEQRGMRNGELITLRVTDQGVGIPEEYLKKIFSPFVRLREDIAEGSGLGLTLVRSLVELHGGEVTVRSSVGKGTTVYVTIPTGGESDEVTTIE
jgi:signal transduction histidine kinase